MEAGLTKKWLNDVMQQIINKYMQIETVENPKAIMNMKKFSGALVALGIGYILSSFALIAEIVYFRLYTVNNPYYNKYSKQVMLH